MINLNDIVYGNPPLKAIETIQGSGKEKLKLALDSGVIDEFLMHNPAPANDSEETLSELKELAAKGKLTADENAICEALDEDIYGFFSEYAKRLGIEITAKELDDLTDKYWGIISYIKMKVNRPRPFQLAWYRGVRLFPNINAASANSASYPSGHTFEFLVIMDVLVKKSPETKAQLKALYEKIRNVREISGLHYPSDTKGSEELFGLLKSKGII